jgi:hypothetical protein
MKILGIVVVLALSASACGDTVINNLPPTAPSTPTAPAVVKTAIDFRVVGNASSARVRYSSPVDGLAQVVTSLPYFNGFTTEASSMFLSLEATPVVYPSIIAFPFLSIQIVTGGVTFREATSNDFLLAPLQVSGTWRR